MAERSSRASDIVDNGLRWWTDGVEGAPSESPHAIGGQSIGISSAWRTFEIRPSGPETLGGSKAPVSTSERVDITLTSLDLAFDTNKSPSIVNDGARLEFRPGATTSPSANGPSDEISKYAVVAMPGSANVPSGHATVAASIATGTNHRLLIAFGGLTPSQRYRFTFYAYDDLKRQGVYVFTNVTDKPLRYLNPADAESTKNPNWLLPIRTTPFNPGEGEHGDGTQYAPDGQYIWTNGKVPKTENQYSVPLDATADASGRVVFAETTVLNLYGPYQALPVLSALKVEAVPGEANLETTAKRSAVKGSMSQ